MVAVCISGNGCLSSCTIPGMENARDDIPALDEPAFAGAEGILDAEAAVEGALPASRTKAPAKQDASASDAAGVATQGAYGAPPVGTRAAPTAGAREAAAAVPAAANQPDALPDERRRDLHASLNERISYLCRLAALVMAVVALATMVLGQEMPRYVMMGLCLSVALLAIASLQDYHQRKH